jgi:uncharacterized protein (DUF1697 family)
VTTGREGGRVKRYAAFLRGVSPMNAKMPELKRAFEAAGFSDVKAVLSSGNVVFSAYVPSPRGPVFMSLVEKTLGRAVTTRTWETVAKVAR